MKKIISAIILLSIAQVGQAQALEEIVVTARKSSVEILPGSYLQRKADFLLLEVRVENDSRSVGQRKQEIYETLKGLLSAASKQKNIEVSLVSDGGIVVPMTKDNYRVKLGGGNRPDTSRTSISLKTPIPENEMDGQKLIDTLRKFLGSADRKGRTELSPIGDIEVTVVGPSQYRDQVIDVFAKDVENVTGSLGENYKVIVNGIDRPVGFYRLGLLEIALYIPYSYSVLPESINSYMNFSPEY
jgi:hypothetical protein